MMSLRFTFPPFERIMFKIYSKIFLYDSFRKINPESVQRHLIFRRRDSTLTKGSLLWIFQKDLHRMALGGYS